jgi:hypothetical protein
VGGQSRDGVNPIMNLQISYRRGCIDELSNQPLLEKGCFIDLRKVGLASVLWTQGTKRFISAFDHFLMFQLMSVSGGQKNIGCGVVAEHLRRSFRISSWCSMR